MVLLLLYIISIVLDEGFAVSMSGKGNVTVTPRDVCRTWMAATLLVLAYRH
jgi:hypothetical protein